MRNNEQHYQNNLSALRGGIDEWLLDDANNVDQGFSRREGMRKPVGRNSGFLDEADTRWRGNAGHRSRKYDEITEGSVSGDEINPSREEIQEEEIKEEVKDDEQRAMAESIPQKTAEATPTISSVVENKLVGGVLAPSSEPQGEPLQQQVAKESANDEAYEAIGPVKENQEQETAVLEEDPFEAFYARLKNSKAFKEQPHVAEKLVEAIAGVRSGKLSLEELKRKFTKDHGNHYGFYSAAVRLIEEDQKGKVAGLEVVNEQESELKKSAPIPQETPEETRLRAERFLKKMQRPVIEEPEDKGVVKSEQKPLVIEENENVPNDAQAESSIAKGMVTETVAKKKQEAERFIEKIKRPTPPEMMVEDERQESVETLRKQMEVARRDYARMHYKKAKAWNPILKFFPGQIKREEDNEVAFLRSEYEYAVMKYKDARLGEIRALAPQSGEMKRRLAELLSELTVEEKANLYHERTDAKTPEWLQDASLKFVDWYRGLSSGKKMALSVGMMTAGVGASLAGGTALAAGVFGLQRGLRILGGASAGRGVFQGLEAWSEKKRAVAGKKEAVELNKRAAMEEMTEEEIIQAFEKKINSSIAHSDRSLEEMMKARMLHSAAGWGTFAFFALGAPQTIMEKMGWTHLSLAENTQVPPPEVSGRPVPLEAPDLPPSSPLVEAPGSNIVEDAAGKTIEVLPGSGKSIEGQLIQYLVDEGYDKADAGHMAHRMALDYVHEKGVSFEDLEHIVSGEVHIDPSNPFRIEAIETQPMKGFSPIESYEMHTKMEIPQSKIADVNQSISPEDSLPEKTLDALGWRESGQTLLLALTGGEDVSHYKKILGSGVSVSALLEGKANGLSENEVGRVKNFIDISRSVAGNDVFSHPEWSFSKSMAELIGKAHKKGVAEVIKAQMDKVFMSA